MCAVDTAKEAPSRKQVWRMFDRIAHRYDLLNRLLSFGRDVAWRKELARHVPDRPGLHVLDLATGTADVLLSVCEARPGVEKGVGLDPSWEMLIRGRDKIVRRGLGGKLGLVRGDAAGLGLAGASFDVVTISFGIRNVEDVDTALREMRRILRVGGRALVLEFSLPGNRLFRSFYLWYFRHVLPRVGGLTSGDAYAYRYLNTTVETFPHGQAFCDLMAEAGFDDVRAHPLTFGIATLYVGEKSESGS